MDNKSVRVMKQKQKLELNPKELSFLQRGLILLMEDKLIQFASVGPTP